MTGVEHNFRFPYLYVYRSYMYRVITNYAGDYITLLLIKGEEHKNYTRTFIKSNAKQSACVRKKQFHPPRITQQQRKTDSKPKSIADYS
jgi:hypothetical protein